MPKLYEFKIPCSWAVYGNIFIKAENLEEAIEKVTSDFHINDVPVGNYMDGSFEIDSEYVDEMNSRVLQQIEEDNKNKNQLNNIIKKAFPVQNN
jgi:hypothetical protein